MHTFEMKLADASFEKALAVCAKHRAPDAKDRALDLYQAQRAAFADATPANAKEAAARLAYVVSEIAADSEAPLGCMAGLIDRTRRALLAKKTAPYLARRLKAVGEIAREYDGGSFLVRILESAAAGMARPQMVQ